MSIELAPRNKLGLRLESPLMAGSGAVGFADAWPPQVSPALFGAVVTAPLSLTARAGLPQPRLAETPGGFILATGGHNPGYRRALRDHMRDWQRLGIPVVASVAAGDRDQWPELAEGLEESGALAGIELALSEGSSAGEASQTVAAVRRATTLPLLARLPACTADTWAKAIVQAGADGLVVGTAPRGAFPAPDGTLVEGPVGGPIALPFTLRALRAVARIGLDVPLVAAGGIQNLEQARLCLQLGAVAVQIRSLLWIDPAAVTRLSDGLRGSASSD